MENFEYVEQDLDSFIIKDKTYYSRRRKKIFLILITSLLVISVIIVVVLILSRPKEIYRINCQYLTTKENENVV